MLRLQGSSVLTDLRIVFSIAGVQTITQPCPTGLHIDEISQLSGCGLRTVAAFWRVVAKIHKLEDLNKIRNRGLSFQFYIKPTI